MSIINDVLQYVVDFMFALFFVSVIGIFLARYLIDLWNDN